MRSHDDENSTDPRRPPTLLNSDIVGWVWRLFRPDGLVATEALLFLADGVVRGHDGTDESGWRIVDGLLCFTNLHGDITTRFDNAFTGTRLILEGRYKDRPDVVLRLERQSWQDRDERPANTAVLLRHEIEIYGWQIGRHTYGRPTIIDAGDDRLIIGRFGSIADGVTIALGNHQTSFASTYPFWTLRTYWPSTPAIGGDHASKGPVTIGNDVWIGTNSFIGSGITIGDGAVIGAHTVVVKDVPPYAVCAGNPGRVVKYRFPDAAIRSLLAIRWWDWPDERIDRFLPLILSADIDAFITACDQEAGDPS